jgi:hypothetical protein
MKKKCVDSNQGKSKMTPHGTAKQGEFSMVSHSILVMMRNKMMREVFAFDPDRYVLELLMIHDVIDLLVPMFLLKILQLLSEMIEG